MRFQPETTNDYSQFNEELGYCSNCFGSAEGNISGDRCTVCNGSGMEPNGNEDDNDDFD